MSPPSSQDSKKPKKINAHEKNSTQINHTKAEKAGLAHMLNPSVEDALSLVSDRVTRNTDNTIEVDVYVLIGKRLVSQVAGKS
jgi:hypothetical protein